MNIFGRAYRTIWPDEDGVSIHVIDQTKLPHQFQTLQLSNSTEVADAIVTMVVRGALDR